MFTAESAPYPIKKNPIPINTKLGASANKIIPIAAIVDEIKIALFLPILSTIIEIEIYPKKEPRYTIEDNRSTIQLF